MRCREERKRRRPEDCSNNLIIIIHKHKGRENETSHQETQVTQKHPTVSRNVWSRRKRAANENDLIKHSNEEQTGRACLTHNFQNKSPVSAADLLQASLSSSLTRLPLEPRCRQQESWWALAAHTLSTVTLLYNNTQRQTLRQALTARGGGM